MPVQRMSARWPELFQKYVEDQLGHRECKIRGPTYGPWSVRAWKKPNLDREKTGRAKEFTPTPRAMGVVEVSDLRTSLLLMLGTLSASKTSGV